MTDGFWLKLRRYRERGNPLAGPLGRKLLGWFLLFSLLPLFGSNAFGYLRSEALIEGLVERYLEAVAQVEAEHVAGELVRQRLDLKAIAAGNEFLSAGTLVLRGEPAGVLGSVATPAAVGEYLERKGAEFPQFEYLVLLDDEGRLLAAAGPDRRGDVPPPSGPVEALRSLEPLGGPGEEGPRFLVSTPVETSDGVVVGYLGGVLGREGLGRLLELPEQLAGTVESVIVDSHGHPIYVSNPHGDLDYRRPLAVPVLAEGPGEFGRYMDRSGVSVIATSAVVPGSGWRYLAEVPVEEVLGPLRMLRRLSLVLGILFATLLMVTAWFVAGGIVAPVRRLVEATRRVAKGDMGVRVADPGEDEIGELGAAFNDMTRELQEASTRVAELHQREIERAHQLATVGELASGVAHEIKNPLVGISNGLDLVQRRVGEGETEELEPIMTEMQHQVARIETAVRDLLAFARPATPSLAAMNGYAVLERAARLVQPAAERAGVRVDVRQGPGPMEAPADEELIRQALVNLLLNAVHAAAPGGHVDAAVTGMAEELEFRVEDSGHGIAEADLEHIFKPFYTTRHAGTGLGLSITREIVDRHGGRLEVETRLGEGTRFTLALPRTPERPGEPEGVA